jgi:Uncharacterized protein conserved in bacteria (DUF2330)
MRCRVAFSALFAAGLFTFGVTHDSLACGACISPPGESTVVTGHRMALSISPKQTVLWDQIEYAGAPESFAWVLPVKPGAIIQLSTDAWFDTLDATTTTQILPPRVSCGGDSSFGCGNSFGNSGGATALAAESSSCVFCESEGKGGGFAPPPVTVVSRGSVGPYSMVTLSTDTPGALNTWLTENGFALDPATQPVVDAYIAEGFDFIALKLLPDKDVRAMKPVRVVQAGANPTLPLRMVAIGTSANVALTLFVISEGRWEAQNFENTIVPSSLVAWDFNDSSSNYSELREKALVRNGGATWLTAFAFQGALLTSLPSSPGLGFGGRMYRISDGSSFANTIAEAYIRQGISNGDSTDDSCLDALDGVTKSKMVVARPCPLDTPLDDPACDGSVGMDEINARTLACGLLDDVAVALNGLHPADVWMTRIEANLPHSALNKDLVLQAASLQSTEDNMKQAGMGKHVEEFCEAQSAIGPLGANGSRSKPRGNDNLVVLVGFAALLLAAMMRRRGVTGRILVA